MVALSVLFRKSLSYEDRRKRSLSDLLPGAYLTMAGFFFASRFHTVKDLNERWWLLTNTSEDNAAWLNMAARAAVKNSIAVEDIQNLGHTLPSAMWLLHRVGDLLSGDSVLTSGVTDPSDMAAGILIFEALLISISVCLASAIVVRVTRHFSIQRPFVVNLFLSMPAVASALLGGLVLARFGYLSALAALVGIQSIAVILLSTNVKHRSLWLALAALTTGLSWFPIIPVVLLGLVFNIARDVRAVRSSWQLGHVLQMLVAIVCAIALFEHLRQILRRYPDVDRLQGSMWIGSENMLTFFVVFLVAGIVVTSTFLNGTLKSRLIIAFGITTGWLALVWFNDLVRTGGPAHYGTTKLTFVIMYGLLALLFALTALGVLSRFAQGSELAAAFAIAGICSVGVTSLSNDFNALWPRKPSTEEVSQNAIVGILPLISKAAAKTPLSVVCLFVGDFEASGVWQGSYPCTRWGSSLSGVDGPRNEAFRQVILGNADPQGVIPELIESNFFDRSFIVTDNPERLKSLDPWGIISSAEPAGARFVVFRPSPRVIPLAKIVPAGQ
jgi:hypothetical protein